jgi:two-component system, NtrC family, response regulator AlgB
MRALIVDDEKTVRLSLGAALESFDYEMAMAADGRAALRILNDERGAIDVVLLDVRLSSEESGLDLLGEILQIVPGMPVIVITAYASIDTAVDAMRRVAFDYVPKPCTPAQLRQALRRAEAARQKETKAPEVPELDLTTGSTSSAMQEALNIAFKAASSDATVLLLGESGTGKSALARAIHRHGPRAAGPFVPVSCQSHAEDVLDAELFGHRKGEGDPGKIAAAEGGTLFLEEVANLPAEVQAKLLHLLCENEYERAGESGVHSANVRVVSATSHNMQEAAARGMLRPDLYYRLSVIPITLPPLRARSGDIDALVDAYLKFFGHRYSRPPKRLTAGAVRRLKQYNWPGNLRELRNVIERAVILSNSDEIDIIDLPNDIRSGGEGNGVRKSTLEEIQNEHIRHVLANTASLQEASSVLGIDPATLYRKRKRLGT